MQASKDFPQLKEHALQLKCQPTTEFGIFMRDMLHKKTKSSYDNVIATSSFYDDEDEEVDESAKALEEVTLTHQISSGGSDLYYVLFNCHSFAVLYLIYATAWWSFKIQFLSKILNLITKLSISEKSAVIFHEKYLLGKMNFRRTDSFCCKIAYSAGRHANYWASNS